MLSIDLSLESRPSAPRIVVSEWLNTNEPLVLEQLSGYVVILHAFQMLCPACVSHGIPQVKRLHNYYLDKPVRVIGLHSVFEHHSAMQKPALEAFIHEYRVTFPVAIDQASKNSPIPQTMRRYGLRGTPSLIIIDQQGKLRLNHFGHIDDLVLGDMIGSLLSEKI